MTHTQTYIDEVAAKYAKGNATEHTYRPPMESYLHALLESARLPPDFNRSLKVAR